MVGAEVVVARLGNHSFPKESGHSRSEIEEAGTHCILDCDSSTGVELKIHGWNRMLVYIETPDQASSGVARRHLLEAFLLAALFFFFFW